MHWNFFVNREHLLLCICGHIAFEYILLALPCVYHNYQTILIYKQCESIHYKSFSPVCTLYAQRFVAVACVSVCVSLISLSKSSTCATCQSTQYARRIPTQLLHWQQFLRVVLFQHAASGCSNYVNGNKTSLGHVFPIKKSLLFPETCLFCGIDDWRTWWEVISCSTTGGEQFVASLLKFNPASMQTTDTSPVFM